jgi:hypothetical protein
MTMPYASAAAALAGDDRRAPRLLVDLITLLGRHEISRSRRTGDHDVALMPYHAAALMP